MNDADGERVLDVDDVEEVVVHLLGLTWPEAQFGYGPAQSGDVFAGWHNGYHRSEDESVYVTGLSDVLDSVRETVQGPREDRGGHIYVADGRVASPSAEGSVHGSVVHRPKSQWPRRTKPRSTDGQAAVR